jgi:serine/threonine protein kinase
MREFFEKYETPHRFLPEIGDFINGYQITSELGEGAFGKVFKVKTADGSVQSLKLIKLWEIAFEKERKAIIARFIREFEISTVNSKYLVKSFDYGKILGNPYFLMEYCGAGSLEKWCGKFASFPHFEQVSIHILKGLHELHTKGYVHRDIKPANILLTDDNRAKLADFGIAGDKNSKLTVTNIFGKPNQIFGTWAYLAPEQENNMGGKVFKSLNNLSDIFSFGVTMFELFTGELPFPPYEITTQSDLVEYRSNVKKGNFSNLEVKKNLIPANWQAVLEGSLQPDFQKKRFRDINEIVLKLGFVSIVTGPPLKSIPEKLGIQITYGAELNKIYPLFSLLTQAGKNILTVGRKDDMIKNDIEIEEAPTSYISRRHATFEKWENPSCWRIRDGQWTKEGWKTSVNGLFVNSTQVGASGVKLEEGNIITIGDTILKVVAL